MGSACSSQVYPHCIPWDGTFGIIKPSGHQQRCTISPLLSKAGFDVGAAFIIQAFFPALQGVVTKPQAHSSMIGTWSTPDSCSGSASVPSSAAHGFLSDLGSLKNTVLLLAVPQVLLPVEWTPWRTPMRTGE